MFLFAACGVVQLINYSVLCMGVVVVVNVNFEIVQLFVVLVWV